MFSRVYPDKNPSYSENGDLFKELWKDAIIQQQNDKVVWNIGFRGQGDRPF
ncbi:glycosyl hydrolase 115 family protein [Metabacillus endolithicus]|nr:glycosyl hydrolase 115 family protein [Metabacillus endolithicus]